MTESSNRWDLVPGDDGLAFFSVTPNLTIGAETNCVGASEVPGYTWYVMLHWLTDRTPHTHRVASSEEQDECREHEPYPTLAKAMAAAENWFRKYGDDLLERLSDLMRNSSDTEDD